MEKWPIGVFASIDAGLGIKLEVLKELGCPTVQIHAPSKEKRTPEYAQQSLDRCREMGIEITAVFGGFAGESYADMETVKKTIGLVPPEFRAERAQEMKDIADYAKLLGVKVVALHIGFIPHDSSDPLYQGVVEVTQDVCAHCKQNGQALHLETGQETAEELVSFIEDTGCDNLFVNFDPANMILYGTGEPIPALKRIGKYVQSVHAKDGKWSDQPGVTFGEEVPLGEGDVGMETFLRTLDELGYTGPLTIEREIPEEPERQKSDIGQAIRVLEELREKIG